MENEKVIFAVYESDSNGRDYPTFYEERSEAEKHYEESKATNPEYVSIRECIVTGFETDEMEILDEDNIDSYYSEDDEAVEEGENKFVVNVGNIGNIQEETIEQAIETFNHYVSQSKNLKGCRCEGESVHLLIDGELDGAHSYIGHLEDLK